MTIEFAFSSKCNNKFNDPQVWVWFPGWGFKAEIFTQLAQSLPGQHYWYRWSDHHHFDSAVHEICQHIPKNAILIGWSLGGAIAQAAAHQLPSCSALITLATPPKFCQASHWPGGMTLALYDNFVAGFKSNPKQILFKFLALNAQGSEKPKAIMHLLANYQLKLSDSLFYQLLWLNQYDWSVINKNAEIRTNKSRLLSLHLFAERDALVTFPKHDTHDCYEQVPSTCHALFIQQPDTIKEYCLNVYDQLNLA